MNAKTCPDENVTRALKARSEASHLLSILQWPCRTKTTTRETRTDRCQLTAVESGSSAGHTAMTARGPRLGGPASVCCAAATVSGDRQVSPAPGMPCGLPDLPAHSGCGAWTISTSAAADRARNCGKRRSTPERPGTRHSDETRSTRSVLLGKGPGTGQAGDTPPKERTSCFFQHRPLTKATSFLLSQRRLLGHRGWDISGL